MAYFKIGDLVPHYKSRKHQFSARVVQRFQDDDGHWVLEMEVVSLAPAYIGPLLVGTTFKRREDEYLGTFRNATD